MKTEEKGHLEVPEMFHMTRKNGLLSYSLTKLKKELNSNLQTKHSVTMKHRNIALTQH